MSCLAATSLALVLLAGPPDAGETRTERAQEVLVSLDSKDADVLDVVRLLAEAGGLQVVADPAPPCRITLRLERVRLAAAFEAVLRACALGTDEEGGIVRVAPAGRLAAELEEQRRLADQKRLAGPLRTRLLRLSYARAAELAPLIRRFLSSRGEVSFDARTNTLIVTDVP